MIESCIIFKKGHPDICFARLPKYSRKVSLMRGRRRDLLCASAAKQQFSSFEDMISNADVPLLVDFYATWCGPCQLVANELQVSTSARCHGGLYVLRASV